CSKSSRERNVSDAQSRQVEFFKRAKSGFLHMSARSIVTFGLQTASVLVLARFLEPESYGLFGILYGWVAALSFLTDVGVGGSLVHQIDAPTARELRAFFGLRLVLGMATALALWLLAPAILNYYGVPEHDEYRWMALLLPISVLSTAPRTTLARKFSFREIARIDLYASVAAYGAQISAAIAGAGAWSLVIGVAARGLADALLSNYYSIRQERFVIWPGLEFASLKRHFNYGVLYQLNAVVTASRTIVIPLVAKQFLVLDQLGLIFWIAGLVSIPFIFASTFNGSFFPVLSRLRDQPAEARAAASGALPKVILGFGFIYGLGAAAGPHLIPLLFSAKWHAASSLIHLEALAAGLATVRFLGNTILTAMGRPGLRAALELKTIVFTAAAMYLFGSRYGMHGYYYGFILAEAAALALTAWSCRAWLDLRVFKRFTASIAAAACGFGATSAATASLPFAMLVFAAVFTAVALVIDPRIIGEFRLNARRVSS
ncbi:MAG TPA: oligosaccharide flippase family protein, partial [Bdellovibrionales bacterium]|nr:oligosaccharide flippase family protein [Bdellovibrionales bacterium]